MNFISIFSGDAINFANFTSNLISFTHCGCGNCFIMPDSIEKTYGYEWYYNEYYYQ